MKIGVISDTHDRLENVEKAVKVLKNANVGIIVHCGDWVSPFTLEFFDETCAKEGLLVPVKSVFGNNEGDIKRIIERNTKLKNPIQFAPKTCFELEIENIKIVVYHGHDKVILQSFISSKKYHAVFTGHTHKPKNENIEGVLVVNPGSVCNYAESCIVKNGSLAIYDSKDNKAEIIMI
jgi:hypothetical protein